MIAAHARTLRESVEFYLKTKIPDNHPILAWLVDYCGTLITLYSKGSFKDGLTPIQRMKGKPWRTGVPPFLEKVEYKRRSKNKFDGRWRPGCYLGVDRKTSERIIGDPEGTYVVQSEEKRFRRQMGRSVRTEYYWSTVASESRRFGSERACRGDCDRARVS